MKQVLLPLLLLIPFTVFSKTTYEFNSRGESYYFSKAKIIALLDLHYDTRIDGRSPQNALYACLSLGYPIVERYTTEPVEGETLTELTPNGKVRSTRKANGGLLDKAANLMLFSQDEIEFEETEITGVLCSINFKTSEDSKQLRVDSDRL